MVIAPGHQNNSWWDRVGEPESVEKKTKKLTNGREPKKMKNVGSLLIVNFFNFFQLITALLLIPTNYCFHDLVLRPF